MDSGENLDDIATFNNNLEDPVLIFSTHVGRGMYTLGEAFKQRFDENSNVLHYGIEEFLPEKAVNEDVKRYKFISNNLKFLLYFMYKIPFFYQRKKLREMYFPNKLDNLKNKIEEFQPNTIICISHRASFWVSSLKRQYGYDFKIHTVLGEYGPNLGYKYIFWDEINGFLSPVPIEQLKMNIPKNVEFRNIELPAKIEYKKIKEDAPDPNKVILICGYWGQGPMIPIIKDIISVNPDVVISVVTGENDGMKEKIKKQFKDNKQVEVHGKVESLIPFLEESGSIITKPGISTLLESRDSGRKIFLIKGMPIAEENNARYAIKHFNASWFSKNEFKKWIETQQKL